MTINWEKIEAGTLIFTAASLPIGLAPANLGLGVGMLLVIRKLLVDSTTRKLIVGGITVPLLLYLGMYLTATVFSKYQVNIAGFFEDKWVVSAYFVALGLSGSLVIMTRALVIQIISGSVIAAYAILQFITGYDIIRAKELEPISGGYMALGLFSHHLTYGGVALIIFVIALTCLLFSKPKNYRNCLIFMTTVSGIGLVVSYARSAILGLGAAFLIFFLTASSKMKLVLVGSAVVGVIGMLVVMPGMSDRFMKTFKGGDESETTRIRLWQTSAAMIGDHPMLGVGQSNFLYLFEKYKVPGYYDNHSHPHNDMITIAVDGGILTLLCFIGMWIVFFFKGTKLVLKLPHDSQKRWILLSGMAVAGSILVAGQFQNYLADAEVANMVWFSVGIMFGLNSTTNTSLSDW